MPNVKSLKAIKKLMRELKQLDKEEGIILGTGAGGLGGLGYLHKLGQDKKEEAEAKRATFWKPFYEGIGTTGPLTDRPTADIAARTDFLKENIPNIRYGWKELSEARRAPFELEQQGLEHELSRREDPQKESRFRKTINKLKNKFEDDIE